MDRSRKILTVDLEIYVAALGAALPLAISVLEARGAPKGSEMLFEKNGAPYRVTFGQMEGVTLALDATLPAELWRAHSQELWPALAEAVTGVGELHGAHADQAGTEV